MLVEAVVPVMEVKHCCLSSSQLPSSQANQQIGDVLMDFRVILLVPIETLMSF